MDDISEQQTLMGSVIEPDLRLAKTLQRLDPPDGDTESLIKGVGLLKTSKAIPRSPLIYRPSLIIIAQGQKTGYLGSRRYVYNPGNYLVQTLPLPFECETKASEETPLLGLSIHLDLAELKIMADQMECGHGQKLDNAAPMAAVKMGPAMEDAINRLAETLNDPQASRILGNARRQEVMFELLRGDFGPQLGRLLCDHRPFARIVSVLNTLHEQYDQPLNVSDLAASIDMSVSSFHQHFKAITQTSPLQYQKQIRLLKAQQLILSGAVNITHASVDVGYDSNSQFSREYKRYFGHTPREELKRKFK